MLQEALDRPDAVANLAKNFRQLLTTLEDGVLAFPIDIEYDVCCKCYDVYRGPAERLQRAESCRNCGHP